MPQRGLHHIAYWVDDLATAMIDAEALLGVGPFRIIEHIPLGDFEFRGQPALLDQSAAFAQWGPVILELVQVHEAVPAALREALRIAPGAVSHTSWWTDDLRSETEHMAGVDCALVTTSVGGAIANWYTGGRLFAHAIEIHQPTELVREMWSSLSTSENVTKETP